MFSRPFRSPRLRSLHLSPSRLSPRFTNHTNRLPSRFTSTTTPTPPFEEESDLSISKFYLIDDRGNWKCVNPVVSVSWEKHISNVEISDKIGFLTFVRKLVRWMPESRSSPSELLEDPWLVGTGEK